MNPTHEVWNDPVWPDVLWWCPIHRAAHEEGTDCWGAGLDGIDNCESAWLEVRLFAPKATV